MISKRFGLMGYHQTCLVLRKLIRLVLGANLPPLEVIMSRSPTKSQLKDSPTVRRIVRHGRKYRDLASNSPGRCHKSAVPPHAVQQMSRPERMISPAEVRSVINTGEVIEDYPEDARGHSCLLLGHGTDNRPLHVVCAPKAEYLAITTAYLPHSDQWAADWRTRKST